MTQATSGWLFRCSVTTRAFWLTAEHCDLATAQLYSAQDVRRILLKPSNVKTALEVIQDLASA